MSAREIIAQLVQDEMGEFNGCRHADAIITALREAGCRVLEPGEVDAETVERCAAVCDENARFYKASEEAQLTIARNGGSEPHLLREEVARSLIRVAQANRVGRAIRALKGSDHG